MGKLQEQCTRLQEAAEWGDTEDTQVSMAPGSARQPLVLWLACEPAWVRACPPWSVPTRKRLSMPGFCGCATLADLGTNNDGERL